MRHVRGVEFGEAKGGFAKLAIFLLRVRQPFHEAILVYKHDAAATPAGMK